MALDRLRRLRQRSQSSGRVSSGRSGSPVRRRCPPFFCFTEGGFGVLCVDPVRVEGKSTAYPETTYLAGTPINAVSVAPDGTVWAVGADDGGALYRITHERPSTN